MSSLFAQTESGWVASAAAKPIIPPADPKVADDARRLSRQCWLIVEAIRTGPKTNVELSAVGLRFGGRLHDLREAGFVIETESVTGQRGLFQYRLVSEPEWAKSVRVDDTAVRR